MKKHLLVFAFTILLISAGSYPLGCQENKMFDTRIVGKWQSDKDKTLAWIKDWRECGYEMHKKVDYGKLILQFTKDEIISSWADADVQPYHKSYKIVAIEGSIIVLSWPHPFEDTNEIGIIKFEGKDTISIYSARYESMEYFKRID
jgi:hypothetical protein